MTTNTTTTATQSFLTITKEQSHTNLIELIEQVTAAERITKAGLASLSRDLLAHAFDFGDVQPINTLMGTDSNGKFRLTPINWRTAAMYFNAFVAFTSNYDKEVKPYATKGQGQRVALVFNKKSKPKYERLLPTVTQWLGDENNNIWTWSDANISMDDKEVDYMALAIKAVKNAMDEDKGGLSWAEIQAAIIADEEVQANLDTNVEASSGGAEEQQS